jgi:hypothetical protein
MLGKFSIKIYLVLKRQLFKRKKSKQIRVYVVHYHNNYEEYLWTCVWIFTSQMIIIRALQSDLIKFIKDGGKGFLLWLRLRNMCSHRFCPDISESYYSWFLGWFGRSRRAINCITVADVLKQLQWHYFNSRKSSQYTVV